MAFLCGTFAGKSPCVQSCLVINTSPTLVKNGTKFLLEQNVESLVEHPRSDPKILLVAEVNLNLKNLFLCDSG